LSRVPPQHRPNVNMKRPVQVLALLLVASAVAPNRILAQQQEELPRPERHKRFHIGVTIGPEITKLKVKLKDGSRPTADAKIGFHTGLALGLDFGPFTIRSGFNFVNAGVLFDGSDLFSESELEVNFITIPVDFRLRPFGTHFMTPYIYAGPEFRYSLDLLERPLTVKENVRLLDATFSVGAGVTLRIPKLPFRFSPEVRYVTDLTGIYSGQMETDDGDFVDTATAIKANAVRVGMLLGF